MDLESIYLITVASLFVCSAIAFPILLKINAPYGRHGNSKFGPEFDARTSWIIMESPALIAFTLVFFLGPWSFHLVPLLFFGLWQAHYVHRTVIFPFRMTMGGKNSSWFTTVMAFVFNVVNGTTNAYALAYLGQHYEVSWLWDPRFVVGVILFAVGFVINRRSDATLRSLRTIDETGYKIPRGGLYRWVSCPNYLGEIVEWAGWALATFNLAGLAFLVFSFANLVPRALAHHKWYKKRFPDYPNNRKAILPGIL